ncbi:alpha-xenorhabdolysin family binary toxin subunit A [Providencia stuartii]|uniref:alpha-xenorhabdolysin family binary toxin subunit A n=1 Tax=Providencia stuartii TaxID=588 RepID=UPI0024ABB0EE|nr:alpha-xenorhabdolysin family binary toxin subunit A [Providencia stuartii]EMA3643027.1 alpha-xenorhabdolysin family binary toxin subunit A [Providencia stuartii]MBW3101484.1 alpha-xenorhabdolysin family binary toxin subunit A [Providencia stuartii]MCB5219043.1 alpha-xenorhabdolysin family binary toxin subunit A [Providencia stuartii]MEB3134473.1 alpha-xenorhabdolysin family binary toxin subunit A [Providencia stuartii]
MSEITYDKIIEKENIGAATLALLTNQDPHSARPAGIFTHQDLVNIHRYTHFALSLPTSTLEIHSWLKINESTDLPIKISALTEVIQLIHTHASGWDGVEQEVKQQSINLSLISRNIVQTGNQIIEYINDMPIIQQIANSIDDLSAEALDGLTYQNDDQQIATELLSILNLIQDNIKMQANKTSRIKNTISDFRAHIIGGALSNNQHVDSLLFKVKSIYLQLDSIDDINSESHLFEKVTLLKKEVLTLEKEYDHFVKLSFTGLAGGLIGLLITGGIFGSKAEKVRHRKNALLKEIVEINNKLNKDRFIKKVIFDIQVHLQKIEGYFKDARLAVDHLDYMWLVILTEIKQSIETFARIDNAANLLKFIARFKKIITAWASVQTYSEQLIELFDIKMTHYSHA